MEKGDPGQAAGAEIAAETKMNPRKQAIPDISGQILAAGQNHLRFVRKEAHHRSGGKLHGKGGDGSEGGGDGDRIAQGQPCAVIFSGTDILGSQRRYRGEHGGGDEEQHTDDLLHDAYGGGIVQSPSVGEYGDHDKRDLDKAVLHTHGDPYFQKTAHDIASGPQIPPGEPQAAFAPQNKYKGHRHTDSLGQCGAQRGARSSQTEYADKEIVQRNIGGTGHGDKVHGAFGVAHAPKDGTDDVVCGDKGNADKADHEIGSGLRHGFRRCGHNGYDGGDRKQQHGGKGQRQRHKQCDGVADDGRSPLFFLCAHGLTDQDGGAHGEAHDHHGEHVHDLTAYGDGGGACDAVELSDDKQIGHSV